MTRRLLVVPFLLMCLFSSVAFADSIGWEQLSKKDKKALQSYKGKWSGLSKSQKLSLRTWSRISPATWKRMKIKYKQWKALSPKQRRSLVRKIKVYKKNTSKDKRARLRRWQKWVNTLPPAVRKKFKKAWKVMSPKDRRAYYHKLKKKYP